MNETEEEFAAFDKFLMARPPSIRDMDIDAFADGVLAHRNGLQFHENPDGNASTVRRLSWSLGWNERALRQP
jgi:hypothetical protein